MHPDRFRLTRFPRTRGVHFDRPILPLFGDQSSGANYYHWLVDILPRAWALEFAQGVALPLVLLPAKPGPFVDQAVRLLQQRYAGLEVETVPSRDRVHAPEVWLATFALRDFSALVPVELIGWLRELFSGQLPDGQDPTVARENLLYIRRRSDQVRSVQNSAAVEQLMTELGFEIIDLEQTSVLEQARLFARARVVVAGHGAGLANIVFSRGAQVIEFAAPGLISPHYAYLCLATGNVHSALWGTGDQVSYFVDLRSLRNSVAAALKVPHDQ